MSAEDAVAGGPGVGEGACDGHRAAGARGGMHPATQTGHTAHSGTEAYIGDCKTCIVLYFVR